jgi:fluoride ion exporter CrcB/FEX
MDKSVIPIAVGAAVGAIIGVLISDVAHLTGYWPHAVVAVCAAAGVFLAPIVYRK